MAPVTATFTPLRRPYRLVGRLRHALSLRKQRLALAALDDHLLADIGLSREDALAEASLPLWDAPGHWVNQARPAAQFFRFSDRNA